MLDVTAVQVLTVPDLDWTVRAHPRITTGPSGPSASAIAAACAAAGTPIPARAITITRPAP
ncbi:hypothetical protein [Dactylosporangium sp. CA-139066]|uniref:hypothetical protein n=1 Tax=Dactylosporangium sp. CA-139066 TaxID=3239930 RepID=UPI003D9156F7